VLLGLLGLAAAVGSSVAPAMAVALVLMLVARPLAVFLVSGSVPLHWREKIFIALDRLARRGRDLLASIPMRRIVEGYLYFDVAFVVVIISLLLQGWTLPRQPGGCTWRCRATNRGPRRIDSICPASWSSSWSLSVRPRSLYFRRGLIPSWSKPTLVIRDQHILSPAEADPVAVRLHLPASAAGKGRGAGPVLRRHGAELGARSASARRLHCVRRAHAWGTCGNLGVRGG